MGNKRDVGKLGENTLRVWAAEEDISINSSDENDKTGWDFLLEFSLSDKSNTAAEASGDLLPQELACFVQVKSTDSKNKSIPIPLEHWKRQVERPNPTFFLVLEFDGKKAAQRAFLVEVDKSLAEKALKRLRGVPENKLSRLHKMNMGFRYSESHKLEALSGEALIKSIREICGPDIKSYCAKKLEWQMKIGYEERPINVQVTFKEEDELERYKQLVSFALGEVDSLPVSSLEIGHSRFGITKRREVRQSDIALKVPKLPTVPLAITIENEFKTKQVQLDADGLFPGSLFPFIPQKYWRIKIESKFLKIHRDIGAGKVSLSFSAPESSDILPIAEWFKILSIIELFSVSHQNGIYIDVFTKKGAHIFRDRIQSQFNDADGLDHLKSALVALKQVLHLSQMPHDLEISTNEIISQANQFSYVEKIIKDKKIQASMIVELLDADEVDGKSVGVFYFQDFHMGGKKVLLAMSSLGPPSDPQVSEAGKRQITLAPIETEIHSVTVLRSDEIVKYKYRAALEAVADKFPSLDAKIILG